METVFITIHDLSQDARIKYCSDSIEYILGYYPHEVTGRSSWDYFHPEEIPFGRVIHDRGISLDKAAVMNYCRIKHKDGSWVGCECVFTVVHDVLVASTAIYRRGPRARQRALEGAGIRRIFSSSPRDPRYHMLSFLSNKFYQAPSTQLPEPRAALFLNRFTRTSPVMYATNSISTILGIESADLIGKSFYYCIQENCLQDAVKCLESAKANDSIAYLRFWYRNPLQEDNRTHNESIPDLDEDDELDGGVALRAGERSGSSVSMTEASTPRPNDDPARITDGVAQSAPGGNGSAQPPSSTDLAARAPNGVLDRPTSEASASSPTHQGSSNEAGLEIEAVVSCSSDGLVVILRRAKPLVPTALGATEAPYHANGLFASPWAPEPVLPLSMERPTVTPVAPFSPPSEPESGFMATIRDVAVFAWSLTGINGSLAEYARGTPSPEALPPGGLPVWDPSADVDPDSNELYNGYLGSAHRPFGEKSDPVKVRKDEETGSSEDEVVWKRTPTLPPWRHPKRRAHHDAFGADGADGGDGENEEGGRKRATTSQSKSGSGSGSGSGSVSGPGSGTGSTSDSV